MGKHFLLPAGGARWVNATLLPNCVEKLQTPTRGGEGEYPLVSGCKIHKGSSLMSFICLWEGDSITLA